MDNLCEVLSLLSSFLMLYTIYWYYKVPKNLPPGPLGLPFVGSLPFISKKPYLTFIDLSKKYGNIFHIYLGCTLIIVLNDFKSIKEAFTRQAEIFSGRFDDAQIKGYKGTNVGLAHNDGEYWRQHRRFLISNLRNNGVGKHVLEPRIMNEIHFFINEIEKTCRQPVNVKNLLNCSLFNNILLLANNTRYSYDNDDLLNFIDSFNQYTDLCKAVTIGAFLPWIKKIPGLEILTKMKERSRKNRAFLNAVKKFIPIEEHAEDSETSYVKAFWTERKRRLEQSENEIFFTEIGLLHNMRDLVAAGGETSASLLNWIMLYLTKHPKVQLKAQEEIDKTLGRDREVTYDDRHQTPYIEAIIMESQRCASLIPLSLPHRNIRETTLFGYFIPTNTFIMPNLYAVHHDPKLWGDPENFRPERFFEEDGKLVKPEYLIPFSLGKRVCAGEPLARMEIYLYLATILQKFKLVPTETYQSLEATDLVIRKPVCGLVCFIER